MSKIVYTKTQALAWVFFFNYIGRVTRPENNTKVEIRKKAHYENKSPGYTIYYGIAVNPL